MAKYNGLRRQDMSIDDCYAELAKAIVIQAIDDIRGICHGASEEREKNKGAALAWLKYSDEPEYFCGVSGMSILKRIGG